MGRRRLAGVLVAVVLGAWVLPTLPAMGEPVSDPVEVVAAQEPTSPVAGSETGDPEALPAEPGGAPSERPEEDTTGGSDGGAEPGPAPEVSPLPERSETEVVPDDLVTDDAAAPAEEPTEQVQEAAEDPADPVIEDELFEGQPTEDGVPEDGVGLLAVGDVTLEIVSATCIGAGLVPSATVTAAVGNVGQDEPVDVDVELVGTGSDGERVVITSVGATVAPGETEQLALQYRNPGSYDVEVVVEGEDGPSASAPVQTALCLVVSSSCDSVTFGNAEGNPPVLLSYTDVYSGSRPEEVELAPGESLTLTDVGASWTAVSSLDQVVRAGQGFAEPTYEPCGPQVGVVSSICTAAGSSEGVVEFEAYLPAGSDVSWRVLTADGRTVAEGSFEEISEEDLEGGFYAGFSEIAEAAGVSGVSGVSEISALADAEEDGVLGFASVEGLAVGQYQVQLLDGATVVRTVPTTVLTCLDVTAVCDDVTLVNPATNPTVFGYYVEGDEDGGDVGGEFELAPGESRTDTLDVPGDVVLVVAFDSSLFDLAEEDLETDDLLDLTFDFAAFQEVELGLGCDPVTDPVGGDDPTTPVAPPAAGTGTGTGTGAGSGAAAVGGPAPVSHSASTGSLAATGGPALGLGALGLLSVLGGLAALVRRRA